MIPRISKGGRGFRGAQAYYVHDKDAATSARVGFIELVNLPSNPKDTPERNADRAFAVMAWTASNQQEIKEAAGGSSVGRKLDKPVYTYSLSWAPEDAAKATDAHMKAAALSSLKALGMDDRQAIIIRHNDTAHPHVHVIVNRVCPSTGKAATASRDHLKLSTWAQQWEKKHGLTVVQERVRNNGLRAEEAKLPQPVRKIIKSENLTREEYQQFKSYRGKTGSQVVAMRSAQQDADRRQVAKACDTRATDAAKLIAKQYQPTRDALTRDIVALQTRMDRKGLFASIVAFKRRLTGELAQDQRTLAGLQKSRLSVDARVDQIRADVAAKNSRAMAAMENRHAAELDRDKRYLAWRERSAHSSSSSDGALSPKVQRMRVAIGPRFVPEPQQRVSRALEHGEAVAKVAPRKTLLEQTKEATDAYLARTGKAPLPPAAGDGSTDKKWSRATGRNPDRPKRERKRADRPKTDRDPDRGYE